MLMLFVMDKKILWFEIVVLSEDGSWKFFADISFCLSMSA